jgi:hypothetical protein
MSRRWVVALVAIVGVAAAGAVIALVTHDSDNNHDTAARTTTSSSTTSTSTTAVTTTTSTTTTTTPTTTTAPPPVTGTAPGPCGAQLGAIRSAIDASVSGAQSGADTAECRLAASDPSWAAVHLVAKPGASFDATTVVLHDDNGAWTVIATDGPSAGCGKAPQQVIADLGQFCVGTGGGA